MRIRRFRRANATPVSRFAYWQEIVAVLCLKAAGLVLLYMLFFAPADRPAVTQQTVARHLLTMPGWATSNEVIHDR
jgi:hypothetical protein